MKRLALFIATLLLIISCENAIGVIEEPENDGLPWLLLVEHDISSENGQALFKYESTCDCEYIVEGQTMTYRITKDGEYYKSRSNPNRGQFGCSTFCKSTFAVVFSQGYFEPGHYYEIEMSYSVPDTDCFRADTLRNTFNFKY